MTLEKKIAQFANVAESMPGVVVIHDLKGFAPVYMTSNGLRLLGLSMDELLEIGEDYQREFLNEDFVKDYFPFLNNRLQEKGEDTIYNTFHQVQLHGEESFDWYITSVGVFHHGPDGKPSHIVTIAFPLGDLEHIPQKAERMLNESIFVRQNRERFLSLSNRAKEVLQLVALGKKASEIAEELNISVDTVNSHRRLIKEKLGISSGYQFAKYARAFDLV